MIIKKETLVFLTSLAIIFIIGYVNMTMSSEGVFSEDDYAQYEQDMMDDYANLGDITDITDIASGGMDVADTSGTDLAKDESFDVSFDTFKITKEKNNQSLVDHLEQNLTNDVISQATKEKFEDLLVTKNNNIKTESNIELMLQSKGYNETVAVVDNNTVKVITNDNIEQADAVKILDVIVSETNFEPSQIKIVKFKNLDA